MNSFGRPKISTIANRPLPRVLRITVFQTGDGTSFQKRKDSLLPWNAGECPSGCLVYIINTDQKLSVADIRDSLFQTWNNPKLSAYVLKDHEYTVASLYATTKSAKPKRKAHFPDPDQLTSDVSALQRNLDAIKLSSWKYVDICLIS